MIIEAGLVLSRFIHYFAVTALFGIALFPFYTSLPESSGASARLQSWPKQTLALWAFGAFVSGLLWLAFVTASMNDEAAAAINPRALWSVISETSFGRLWSIRLALSVLLFASISAAAPERRGRFLDAPILLFSAALLATLAGTGHAQDGEGFNLYLHVVADGAHLLAAGAWLGGLLVLGIAIEQQDTHIETVLLRFSGMGYVAVAVLLISGLMNSWLLVGSVSRLWNTLYGQILLAKLMLFLAMLVLAALNRFWLVPGLAEHPEQEGWLTRLRRNVLGEHVLGTAVLVLVGILGTLEPGS